MADSTTDRFVRRQGWLEPVGDFMQKIVGGIYGPLGRPGRFLKDQMHGALLGHPLHPALTDVPLGAWTVGVVADYAALATRSIPALVGDFALGVGILGALAAAVTGYTDHHETFGNERRVATLHGLVMTVVLLIELASIGLRLGGGSRPLAIGLASGALALALAGAFLGGHLVFGLGTMVNRNAFAQGPEDFVPIGAPKDFAEGKLTRVDAGGMPALVVRVGGKLNAISAVCSHAGGPLDEGTLEADVVTCPWHGSRFCVADGAVRGGPATFAQPAFEVREREGKVEAKLAQPLH